MLLYWFIFVYHATPVIGAAAAGGRLVLPLASVLSEHTWRVAHGLPVGSDHTAHTTTTPSVSVADILRFANHTTVMCRCADQEKANRLRQAKLELDQLFSSELTGYDLDLTTARLSLPPARAIPMTSAIRDGTASVVETLEDTLQEYNAALWRAQGKADPLAGKYQTRRKRRVGDQQQHPQQQQPSPQGQPHGREAPAAGDPLLAADTDVAPTSGEVDNELSDLSKFEPIIALLAEEEQIDSSASAAAALEIVSRTPRTVDQLVEEFKVMFAEEIAATRHAANAR